jgi:ankyrin repeat protein
MKNKLFYVLLLFTTVCNVRAADISKEEQLRNALENNDIVQVQELINEKVNVNCKFSKGFTPLMDAYNSPEIAQALLEAGARVNQKSDRGVTALTMAVSFGRKPEVVKILLSAGADMDVQDAIGWTPLMAAASIEKSDFVKLLLGRGANKSLKNKEGKTAADIAREYNRNDLAVYIDNYVYDKGLTKSAAKKK